METKIKWSHSRVNQILECPMSYFLNYVEGIKPVKKKSALEIGSAVHWMIEHNTNDLTDYIKENGAFSEQDAYSKDQMLAEAMYYGYTKHHDRIFSEILNDGKGGVLPLLDEQHELSIEANLKSYSHPDDPHIFLGIIDLLLLTEKGFIVIDYKTSSQTPDWSKYLEQIYRYIFLLRETFPDVPVYKIGIINLKKTGIKQKQKETEEEFYLRLKREYEINDESYVCCHVYDPEELDKTLIDNYIDNLSRTVDFADNIEKNKMWFINYSNAVSVYGKSQYWDIFYNTPMNYLLYKIKDTIYNEDEGSILSERDCVALDMEVIKSNKVLNKYSIFKDEVEKHKELNKEQMNMIFKDRYLVDESLLNSYWLTKEKESEHSE